MAKAKKTILGHALPHIPWENRPAGCSDVVWRYSRNPIIPRNPIPKGNSTFNSAVVPFKDGFAGVFQFIGEDPEITRFEYQYDPRVCWLEDRYYVTWCNGYHGPTIGVGYTYDFESFHQLENAFLPYNRNGVLFPRKINGKYALLSRPSDTGHTPFGDIFYSESPDMIHWGRHRFVMAPKPWTWQSTKVGPGPTPIETTEGWLLIYHGVLTSCNGYVYSMSAALLDIDQPWKVISRSAHYFLSPRQLYECVGDVPNVTFPCAALTDAETGRIAIYYGAADTVTCLAFAYVDELIDFVKSNSEV
jgi:beta-1,4-mannooligosaccharide/beta-1,4-mannosyl-N-acetylglucosamine phosphorylase